MRVLTCLFLAIEVLSLTAAYAVPASGSIPDQVQAYEARMAAAKTLNEKLGILRELKVHVSSTLKSEDAHATAANRAARLTLAGLSEYLGEIDDKNFTRARCNEIKDSIFFSFSPESDTPKYVPGEAKVALKVLSILCG